MTSGAERDLMKFRTEYFSGAAETISRRPHLIFERRKQHPMTENIVKIALWTAAGGGAGYLWHRVVGCASGACPIVRNPYLSVAWGALLGLSMAMGK